MVLASSLPQIYQELRDRQKIVERISLIEFDDEEYQQLCFWARIILQRFDDLNAGRQKEVRIVFLAFACEYVRRKKPTHDNIFWEDFSKELWRSDKQSFISNYLLWPVYEEEGIKQQWGAQNRLIVESLLSEVNASEADKKSCIDFFCWYYQRWQGDQDVTSDLLSKYNQEAKHILRIHEKAFPRFNHDIQLLSHIVQYMSENNITLTIQSSSKYREIILNKMGEKYDINTIAFIRSGSRLQDLFLRLENNTLPLKFLQTLTQFPTSNVSAPNGQHFLGKNAYQLWKTRSFPYGRYKIDQIQYSVVPQQWLSLDTIAEWPYDTLITDNLRSGFVGYKKRKNFEIAIGQRRVDGHKCYVGAEVFVWLGAVPKGEPFSLDGHYCSLAEGIDWDISLHLLIEDEQPMLQLVFNSLKAFFPMYRQKQLIIQGSQNQRWSGYLNFDGAMKRCRSVVLPAQLDTKPIILTFRLNNQDLGTYILQPESAYLFSKQTWIRIAPGSKLSWGEKHYFLLAPSVEEFFYDSEIIKVEPAEINDGHFLLYDITWEDDKQSFSLKVGELTWSFEQRHVVTIQAAPSIVGPFHLARHQILSFAQSALTIYSTMAPHQMKILCQVFYQDELLIQRDLQECTLLAAQEYFYRFTAQFLSEIDQIIFHRYKEHRYGRYDLLLVNEKSQLLNITTLTLLPEPRLVTSLNNLAIEGQAWDTTFSSQDVPLWDPSCEKIHSVVTLRFFPYLQAQSWEAKKLPKGILLLAAEAFRKSLVFPSLGEAVEVELAPILLGFRLYQKEQIGKSYTEYRKVETIDYYALDKTALAVYTRAYTQVKLQIRENVIWSEESDADGFLLEENLQFLEQYIEAELTSISLRCEGVTDTILLHWRPRIISCSILNGIFSGEIRGPKSAEIMLSLYTTKNESLCSYHISCQGGHSNVTVDVSSSILPDMLCYILLFYVLGDGTQLLAAQQLRLNILKQEGKIAAFLEKNLQFGVGLSDASLLDMFEERIDII